MRKDILHPEEDTAKKLGHIREHRIFKPKMRQDDKNFVLSYIETLFKAFKRNDQIERNG